MKCRYGVLVATALFWPSAAFADDAAEAKARAYYRAASAHFEAKRYLEAQASFAAGYELSHKPGFLWNMAECARLSKNRARAIELYQQYLKEAPPSAPQREGAERRLEELGAPVSAAASAESAESFPTPAPSSASKPMPASSSAPTPASSSAPNPDRAPPPPLAPRVSPSSKAASSSLQIPDKTSATSKPITQRWWFWTGAGAVVAAAVVTVVAVSMSGGTPQAPGPPSGNVTVDWRAK